MTFDRLVTVCDSAVEECPIWMGKGKRIIHHSFPDPVKTNDMNDFRIMMDEFAMALPVLLD